MPIEFGCPQCGRRYSVKDALAGKGAKCGKCGQRMRIPQAATAKPKPKQSAPKAAAKSAKSSTQSDSWLDEDLEEAMPAIAPAAAPAAARVEPCPSCGEPLSAGTVLCVACGYDTRTGGHLETRRVVDGEEASPGRRAKSQGVLLEPGLVRGTIFSFLGAMLAAAVWAVLAYFTMYEFTFVAWGLGAVTGIGMALGHHENDDGSWAGIIAAFMALFGILAARVLIVVIFVGAAVASVMGELDFEGDFDVAEFQRAGVAFSIASESLEAQGIDPDDASEKQWEVALAEAKETVAQMSDEEIQQRLQQREREYQRTMVAEAMAQESLSEQGIDVDDVSESQWEEALAKAEAQVAEITEAELEVWIKRLEAADLGMEVDPPAGQMADEVPEEDTEGQSLVGLFFSEMFGPFDSIFILLAFFTAYKLGSGEADD